ncbi:MAG: hypothetical protein KAQ91_08160 [Methylococcales bacterium]|nr:hypothetical protein [Methylococcales bacterium]
MVYYNIQKNNAKTSYYLTLTDFLGTGTILGAGIYVLIGKIAALSEGFAPSSFLLSAAISVFMVFTFAELSSRYPKSAGEAVYVSHASSQPWLSALAGWGIFNQP